MPPTSSDLFSSFSAYSVSFFYCDLRLEFHIGEVWGIVWIVRIAQIVINHCSVSGVKYFLWGVPI